MRTLQLGLVLLMLAPVWAETALVAEYVGDNQIVSADLTAGTEEVILPSLGWVMDVEVDPGAQKLYWIEGPSQILRSDLDGSGVEVVTSGFWFGVGQSGIALDTGAGHIYWNDTDSLWRANLDGSGAVNIPGPWMVTLTGGIDIDVAAGKIYYSGLPQAVPIDPIYRCNFSGSGIEVVWDHPTMLVGNLALDNQNDHIYFSDTNGSGIHRVDKAGQNLTLIHPSSDVCGISVDPANDTVYWVDGSSRGLWRADLDGANPTRVLYTSPALPTAVAMTDLGPTQTPPPPVTCGDCSGNQVGPDVIDALVAAQLAASFEVASAQPTACDVNGSGGVEILDALILAQGAAQLPVNLDCP